MEVKLLFIHQIHLWIASLMIQIRILQLSSFYPLVLTHMLNLKHSQGLKESNLYQYHWVKVKLKKLKIK